MSDPREIIRMDGLNRTVYSGPPSASPTLTIAGLTIARLTLDEGEQLLVEAGADAERQIASGALSADNPQAQEVIETAVQLVRRRLLAQECASLELNDRDNAVRFLKRFPDEYIYARGRGFYGWCGTHYAYDGAEARALLHAGEVANAIHEEARFVTGPDAAETEKRRNRRHQFATTSGGHRPQINMLSQVRPRRERDVNEFDADPLRIVTTNGTIELRRPNGDEEVVRFQPRHEPRHLCSRRIEVDYVPGSSCPKWDAFMRQVQPDDERRVFLQKFAGLALTGVTSHQAIVVHYGTGANGKSTYAKALADLLGATVATVKSESILSRNQRKGEGPSPDLVRLIGARLVQVHEYPRGEQLDEALIKTLTGGERIPVRDLHQPIVELEPRFKLEVYANDKPRISGASEGTWRRLHLVEWPVLIPEAERRPMNEMLAEFQTEGPGILNWLLDGAALFLEQGLSPPASVQEATREYRDDSDPVGVFLRECLLDEPGQRVSALYMFDAYERWCRSNAINIMSQHRFGSTLITHGLKKIRSNGYHYLNVRLHNVPLPTGDNPRSPD